MKSNGNNLAFIVAQAIEDMKSELGAAFDINHINLAELGRRTGISRSKLRRLQRNGFQDKPHGNTGRKAPSTVLTGFTGIIDDKLKHSVTNSEAIFECLQELGYKGGLTSVKRYIQAHQNLVPAKREAVSSQGNRGRRYETSPGECYQMDWGFVNITNGIHSSYQAACFAMICHHCGMCYIEFFPNARQESLFIGMIHAFKALGIPRFVLTDNMKSVVIRRDANHNPVWQADYEVFMKTVGFHTKLCKVRHPFTKGKVERLIRYVKDNFMTGRVFGSLSDLNCEAEKWCRIHNNRYHRAVDCIPAQKHKEECLRAEKTFELTLEIAKYLCPVRKISFDGFVNYEGRRFGVPYYYKQKTCRVYRDIFYLYIYDMEIQNLLATHPVTWSRRDSFCEDQYVIEQPKESPSEPVRVSMTEKHDEMPREGFAKFAFEKEVKWNE